MKKEVFYTGWVWKHHISEHFYNGTNPIKGVGAGKGATIFLDYNKMVEYLKKDGREWCVAKIYIDRQRKRRSL